jgi:hypothetical protein
MKGTASDSTSVIKVFRLGAATDPEPSLNFSDDEAGLLGFTPLPPGGSWLIEMPSKRTHGPSRVCAIGVIVNAS